MKRPFQFRLRTLLIVVAVIASWLGVEMLANRGAYWSSGGGVLIDAREDSPLYIAKARDALTAWLKTKSYSRTEIWPAAFSRQSATGDTCYVCNANGPISAYVVISSSNCSLSAEEGVSTIVHGPLDNGEAAQVVEKDLFNSLQDWGKQYSAANPPPAAKHGSPVNSAK